MTKILAFPALLLVFLFSCGETAQQLQRELMPAASGEVGEMILVIDSTHWSGGLGSQLRKTFRAPMEGLPQDEPMYAVNKVNPKRLNNLLKTASNMIFVMTLDSKTDESRLMRGYFTNQSLKKIQRDSSLWMTVNKDEFAKGQVVMYLFGQDEEQLIDKLQKNQGQLQNYFEGIAQARIQEKLFKSRELEAERAIRQSQDVSIKVPFGWDLAKNLRNFSWLRFLEVDKELNVFIYQEPYKSAEVFDDVPALRDQITETYLRDAEKPDIYIERQKIDGEFIKVFEDRISFNGQYAVKNRSLWKISNNSGGGPYISYTILDEGKQTIYYIEGYVYSPGTDKKNWIRQVDAVLATFNSSPGG
ncbi:MAG: DUF4837 family protein [Bacteroidota bacterium]